LESICQGTGAVIDVDADPPAAGAFLPDYMFESFARAGDSGRWAYATFGEGDPSIMNFLRREIHANPFNPYWIFWLVAIPYLRDYLYCVSRERNSFLALRHYAFFGSAGVIGDCSTPYFGLPPQP